MSNLSGQVYGELCCSVDGGAAPAFFLNRGFNPTIARTGAGDYTLTIQGSEGVNMVNGARVIATLQGATLGMISVEPLTTSTLRVRTVNAAGAATDLDFWLSIQQIAST